MLRRYTGGTQRVLKGCSRHSLKRGRVLDRDVSKVRIGYSAGIQRVLSGYSAVITQRVPKRVPSRYPVGTQAVHRTHLVQAQSVQLNGTEYLPRGTKARD